MCVLLQDERLPAAHQSSEYREIPQNVCAAERSERVFPAAVSVKWRRQFHSLKKTSCEEFNSSNSFQNKHTLKKLYFWSLSKVFQMISFRFFSSSSSSLIFFLWQTTDCCFQFMSTSLCWSTTCNVATTATLRPNFVVRSLKFVWLVWILHFCNFDPLWATMTQS